MENTMETYADAVKMESEETEAQRQHQHAVKKIVNGMSPPVVTSIPEVPVTTERKPFVQTADDERLPHAGTARVNIAATHEKPYGTTADGWAAGHRDQTVLQQHCAFFDADGDGMLTGDEIPERLRPFLERLDADGDGALSRDEIRGFFRQLRGELTFGDNKPGLRAILTAPASRNR